MILVLGIVESLVLLGFLCCVFDKKKFGMVGFLIGIDWVGGLVFDVKYCVRFEYVVVG